MLKAAIEKILSLDEPHIKSIEGRTYVDKNMTMIGKELRADGITMNNTEQPCRFHQKEHRRFQGRTVHRPGRFPYQSYSVFRFGCRP